MDFVRTFLAIPQNHNYQQDILVTEPIAGVDMLRLAGRCSLESGGETYYFVSEETRREFEAQQSGQVVVRPVAASFLERTALRPQLSRS